MCECMNGLMDGSTHHKVNKSPNDAPLHHGPEVHPQTRKVHEPVDGDDRLKRREPGPYAVQNDSDESELNRNEGTRAGPCVRRACLF